ncbi:hypothetical protein IID19_01385 [Patescibacteria group bacterium]|nr:hypothetical protein [Patescibacteria group bacterium]
MSFHEPKLTTIPFVDMMINAGERQLRSRDFLRVTVPRIVPASGACESIDTLFEVGVGGDINWFKNGASRAYMAQTGQLYLESLLGQGGFAKIYCVGPSGRAEPEVDTRHLTEFEMIEIEFRGGFEELLSEIESFITSLVQAVKSVPEFERSRYGLPQDLSHLEHHSSIFPKLEYNDAINELGLEWGDDISSSQEKLLITNHGGGPILIVRFPNPESERMQKLFAQKKDNLAIKFFNMLPDENDPEYVLSADCIVPFGGECVGSAARIWKLEEFRDRLFNSLMFKNLKAKDPNAEAGFAWYLQMLKDFPSVPHAGCGFGMSRIFQYLMAETDITKVVTFPSNRERMY